MSNVMVWSMSIVEESWTSWIQSDLPLNRCLGGSGLFLKKSLIPKDLENLSKSDRRDREMMRWVWWDWERARRIQWYGKDSSDLSGCLGSSGARPGSVLLVVPVPGACLLKIPHRVSIGPGLGVGSWRKAVSVSRRGRIGRSGDTGVLTSCRFRRVKSLQTHVKLHCRPVLLRCTSRVEPPRTNEKFLVTSGAQWFKDV